MGEITADMVKKLRDATNVSMMECKRALAEADGDIAKATKLLRERGMVVAAKKSSRVAKQGLVAAARMENGRIVALVEVNCETDFVARNASFILFVAQIADAACQSDGNLAEQLKDRVVAKVAEIGENIVIRRHVRYVLSGKGAIASYIHPGGKVGVMVEVGCEKDATVGADVFKDLIKDLTFQIAASAPKHMKPEDVPAAEVAAEREIYAKQVTDKPPQVLEKIVTGKLKKYFQDICLLEQAFVKEPKQTVNGLLVEKGKALADTLTIRRFARYQLGE
jgi:elongation factor Ts